MGEKLENFDTELESKNMMYIVYLKSVVSKVKNSEWD